MTDSRSETGPLLRADRITKHFDGVLAVSEASLTLQIGEVLAIVGENGAGKSTFAGILAGIMAPDSGSIEFLGERRTRMSVRLAAAEGIAMAFQTPLLPECFSVAEVLELSHATRTGDAGGPNDTRQKVVNALSELGLDIDTRRRVSDLSLRERHLVDLAAAIASAPCVLILDEPTEGLAEADMEWLFGQIQQLTSRRSGVIYISHRIPEIMRLAHTVSVMRDGITVATQPVGELNADDIVRLIVGRDPESVFPPKAALTPAPQAVLEVSNVHTKRTAIDSLTIQAGRILGLGGIKGQGQEEFAAALGGLVPSSGNLVLGNVSVRHRSAVSMQKQGIRLVPGDRLTQGLFPSFSAQENATMSSLGKVSSLGFISGRKERALARDICQRLDVRASSLRMPVTGLSGGNQQKVMIGRSVAPGFKVLILIEPTQGIDPGARSELYRSLRAMADEGGAVVVVSSDAAELAGLCDSCLVFSAGRVAARLEGEAVTEAAITASALSASNGMSEGTTVEGHSTGKRTDGRVRSDRPVDVAKRFSKVPGILNSVVLVAIGLGLVLWASATHPAIASKTTLGSITTGTAVLGFVALAQTLVVLSGGFDLSVASVMAVSLTVFSFFGSRPAGIDTFIGVLCCIGVGVLAGIINTALIRVVGMSSIVATLVSGIGFGGVAFLVRPLPGGSATSGVLSFLTSSISGFSVILLVIIALCVVLEVAQYRTWIGLQIRALGSGEAKADRLGIRANRLFLLVYASSGLLAALSGIMAYSQTSIGDASSTGNYLLLSLAAVILGGAVLFSGVGSFVGTTIGALFLTTLNIVLTFLGLSVAWQDWIPGPLIVAAGAMFGSRRRASVLASP